MRYDAAGNLVHDSYSENGGGGVYDAEGRMTAAVGRDGNWAYYTYDADGRRVRRKIANEEWWQVYGGGGELPAEYPAGAAPFIASKEYVTDLYNAYLQRGPDAGGLNHWVGNTNSFGRPATLEAFRLATEYRELAGTLHRETFWLVPDHLGTPRMVADRTGSLAGVKRHDYLPFGGELLGGRAGAPRSSA